MPRPEKTYDRLKGRRALVTGGGSVSEGVGKSTSLLFAAEGAEVAVLDMDGALAEQTVSEIAQAGGSAFAVVADVSDPAQCARAVEEAGERMGGLDILVNNVAISPANPIVNGDWELWDKVLATNLTSAAAMSGYAIPLMEAGGGGSIVMISSVAGMLAHGAWSYGTAKAGMLSLARDITAFHGRKGIRANVIAPGHLFTSHIADRLTDAQRAMRRGIGPLGTEGDPWDIAHAAVFLASDEARFIAGVLLPVDGGVTATGPIVAHATLLQEMAGGGG
ncbi:MAG: SDR family oxidoreductase [Novosphingobium sp.]|nr:SDR family oxidoreductase [Novosphingobium sp.]